MFLPFGRWHNTPVPWIRELHHWRHSLKISPRIDGLNKKMLLCVGPTVKRLRQEAHLSQGDLQRVLPGTSRSNISRWESGCPPPGLSYLERFADVIKLPLSAIIIQIEQSALPNE
jgi:DNA-binding XRE family transcriptional regulator